MVPDPGQKRFLQAKLDPPLFALSEAVPAQDGNPRESVAGAQVNANSLALLQIPTRSSQDRQAAGKHPGGLPAFPGNQRLAPNEILVGNAPTRESHGHAPAWASFLSLLAMVLEGPHPALPISRKDPDSVSEVQGAGPKGPRDNRPRAPNREHPVDGKAGQVLRPLLLRLQPDLGQDSAELLEALRGDGGDREDGGSGEGSPEQELRHLFPHQLQPVRLYQIGLGESDHQAGDPQ